MTTLPFEYAPLLRTLQRRASIDRQPLNGLFELTERCNLHCGMCYISQPAGDRLCCANEISPSDWLIIASQAVDSGMVFLTLTGGEIFLRQDFFDIYYPLTQLGLVITLFSNGTLINDEIAKKLAKSPPSRTEITLYGATSKTYEEVTGVKGSFQRCCGGVETLLHHGIPLAVKTTITRQNVVELEPMRSMARKWGVPFIASWLLTKRRDGKVSEVETFRLSSSECVVLERTDQASAQEWSEMSLRDASFGSHENFFCQAGKSAFVVKSTGKMSACVDLPQPAARPIDVGFDEAWKQVQRFVDTAPQLSERCLNCDSLDYCSRCPAWSDLETNTLTDPVPYLCEIARARKIIYQDF